MHDFRRLADEIDRHRVRTVIVSIVLLNVTWKVEVAVPVPRHVDVALDEFADTQSRIVHERDDRLIILLEISGELVVATCRPKLFDLIELEPDFRANVGILRLGH